MKRGDITSVRKIEPQRHVDPGPYFAPKPAMRLSNPKLSAPVGQLCFDTAGVAMETRWRDKKGAWSPWRLGLGLVRFPLLAVAIEARYPEGDNARS